VLRSSIKNKCFCAALLLGAPGPWVITLRALLFRSSMCASKVSWKMAEVIPGDIVTVVDVCLGRTMFCKVTVKYVIFLLTVPL